MGFLCKTCGGECEKISSTATDDTYKCVCCGNVYRVKSGTDYNVYSGIKESKPAPAVKVTPSTMPEIKPQTPVKLTADEVYERNIPFVFELRASGGGKQFSGSGYSVGGGMAVTNAHVVKNRNVTAYACGRKYSAEVVKISGKDDLALIKIGGTEDLKGVKFADAGKIKNGQTVYVIGNSMGGGTCITSGIVSDKRRIVGGKPRLMTDCAVNKGNSGGPAFNDSGEVVGTVVAVTTAAEGMNYAIPCDIVLNFLKEC